MPTSRKNFGQSIAWIYVITLIFLAFCGSFYIYQSLKSQTLDPDLLLAAILKATLAGSLLISLFGFLLARSISSRIDRMTQAAERFIKEDLSGDLPIEKDDELGLLADAMNRMALSLRNRIRQVEGERTKVSAILNHMAEGVIGVDRDLQVTIINPSAQKIFNLSGDLPAGKSLLEITCEPKIDEMMRRAIKNQPYHESAKIEINFDEEKILKVEAIGLPESKSGIRGIVVLYDNTPLQKLEDMRREFVANVSHELKTPLTSIKGFLETLLGGALRDTEKAEGFLKIMQEDSERLTRLIDDLLELSKIESGGMPLKLVSLLLKAETDKVILTLQPRFQDNKIEVQNLIPENLKVLADSDKLKQVLLNLLDNAIKFNKPHGQIFLRAIADNGKIKISVEDTGSGIPSKAIPRVFERFFRVDKARDRNLGGTGLGLSIVKHIIETHGGEVSCKSQTGQGSTFSFTLPAA